MLSLLLIASLLFTEDSIGRDVPLSNANSAVVDADESFEAVALSWWGSAATSVRVRASSDGVQWTEWIEAAIDDDLTDRSAHRYFTAITHFGSEKRFLEYSFDAPSGAIDRATLSMFPLRRGRPAIADLDGVRSRVDWGCPDGAGAPRWTPAYTTVTHLVVHHTAGANSVADWEAEIRSIWHLHTVTNGWGDIGYNFLIDPNGVIYEGRAGGYGAIGAHFSCRNTNTAGVALLGTYSTVLPTEAALASLNRVLAELVQRNAIVPTATVLHVPTGLILPTIIGHRDGNGSSCTVTVCPGDVLYARLPTIRAELACTPAAIVTSPADASITAGAATDLTVKVTGSEPLAYQWYAGPSGNTEARIEQETGATITVSPQVTTSYWVRVSNSCGTVDSGVATVNIITPPRRRRAG